MRLDILPFSIEVGRFYRIPWENRLCTLCNTSKIKDEPHFICNCKFYKFECQTFLQNFEKKTREMLLLTKAKRPLKFKMLCGFNKHVVKLRMHKAAAYAFPIPLNTF